MITPTCDTCNRPYRLRGHATPTTCSPCLRGRPVPLVDPIREWHGLALKASRYKMYDGTPADMPDDGHVDEVAVRRVVNGDRHGARITPRELVCIVHDATHRGYTDGRIAALLDTTPAVVHGLRTRSGIPAVKQVTDEHACRLIVEPSTRALASRTALIQAGVIAA